MRHATAASRAAVHLAPDTGADAIGGSAAFARAFIAALRHLCAYHDCALRDSVAIYLTRCLSAAQPELDLSLLLRLPHTAPPPYVDLTPRRLSTLEFGGDSMLPTPKPAASIAEVRPLQQTAMTNPASDRELCGAIHRCAHLLQHSAAAGESMRSKQSTCVWVRKRSSLSRRSASCYPPATPPAERLRYGGGG